MIDHFIFLLRRLLLILLLIFRWKKGLQQTIILFSFWLLVLAWKLIVRPFRKVILNIQDALFEMFLSTIILIYFKFTNESTELSSSGNPHKLGVIWVTLVILMIFINFIVSSYIWMKKWRIKKPSKISKYFF